MYANPEDFGKDMAAFDAIGDNFWSTDDAKKMRMSRAEFEKRKRGQSLVHSFIDLEGKWHERGDMGWFGMCSDENENTYDGETGEFWAWINSLPNSTTLYLVDCHI